MSRGITYLVREAAATHDERLTARYFLVNGSQESFIGWEFVDEVREGLQTMTREELEALTTRTWRG